MLDDIDDVAGEAEAPKEGVLRESTLGVDASGEGAPREGALGEGGAAAVAGELLDAALDAGAAANAPARTQEGGE